MPRQLPWANKGGQSRTQVKQPSRPAKKHSIPSDVDDDFFSGTTLAHSKTGKGKALSSDDELPSLRTTSKPRNTAIKTRFPSSSPPPIADLSSPQSELMHKGVSKFDLRDDEWMMVEDEFLETAKLFSRHLRIAEYERLKEEIERKKQDAEVSRPVVAGAEFSVEGVVREKVKGQEKKQRRAIRDVFASQIDDDGDGDGSVEDVRASFTKPTPRATNPPVKVQSTCDTDSEDLDASRPPKHRPVLAAPTSTPQLQPNTKPATGRKSASSAQTPAPVPTPPAFAKLAPLPLSTAMSAAKPRSRISRATPFDMLDDYVPKKGTGTAPPVSSTGTNSEAAVSRIGNRVEERSSSSVSQEARDRLAKRKAEREKSDKGKEKEKEGKKKKKFDVDDIPTFLF